MLDFLNSICRRQTKTNDTNSVPMIDTNIGARFSTFLPNNLTLCAGQGVSPKEQLAYLSQVLGFTVTYNDFPKKGEYLSLVSLSTTPPQVSSLLNLRFVWT